MPKRGLTWEDWLKSSKLCAQSMRYYENRAGLIKILPERIAQENVVDHMRKAYHNLDLANTVFNLHTGAEFRYPVETFYDWVVTICYYAMY